MAVSSAHTHLTWRKVVWGLRRRVWVLQYNVQPLPRDGTPERGDWWEVWDLFCVHNEISPILMAVSCLSPVRIQILMSAFIRVSMVSGTRSCSLSSMAVAPSSWRFYTQPPSQSMTFLAFVFKLKTFKMMIKDKPKYALDFWFFKIVLVSFAWCTLS